MLLYPGWSRSWQTLEELFICYLLVIPLQTLEELFISPTWPFFNIPGSDEDTNVPFAENVLQAAPVDDHIPGAE